MSEDLNGCISSGFTTDYILFSSLPYQYTKFQEAKSYYLGQLIITPERK